MDRMSPCMTCMSRQPGCHGLCEAYKTWAEAQHTAKRREADAYYAKKYMPESLQKYTYGQWMDKARRGRGKIT